ncbi:hypothetical protein KKB11_06255, partial [Candidatus Micrarchaeota archaeon]|nr:hypothetical protein [Candidatus Micrarchaeota archaeon]
EEKKIKELAENPNINEMLIQSIAPAIYGHENVKEAIVLLLFGGVKKTLPGKSTVRGNIHILLVGDPGVAKSQILMAVNQIAPKSIYVAGKTSSGVGLCVSPESMILNDNGFKEIGNFVEERFNEKKAIAEAEGIKYNKVSMETFSLNNSLKTEKKNLSKIWKINAPEQMARIELQSGKFIELTPNTKMLRIKNGKIEWIKSMEIQEEDFVAAARKLPEGMNKPAYSIEVLSKDKNTRIQNNVSEIVKRITNKLAEKHGSIQNVAKEYKLRRDNLYFWRSKKLYTGMPLNLFFKMGLDAGFEKEFLSKQAKTVFNRYGKNITLPEKLNNKNLAYLAGLVFGDGSIYLTKQNQAGIRFYNSDEKLLKEFDKIIFELFGLKTEKLTEKDKVPGRRINSIVIWNLLKEFGLSNKKLESKLSHFCTEQSNELLAEVLQGLYDTDGYVSKGSSPHVGLTTISKKLAQTVQLSLLKYGIQAKLRERKLKGRICIGKNITVRSNNNQFYVELRGKNNLELFMESIGFKISRKNNSLKEIIKKISKSNPNIDIVPEIGSLLKEIKASKEFNPTQKKLTEIIKNKENPLLKSLAEANIVWEKVQSKEYFKPEYNFVYDFTVENSHNFIANGVIVHNTASAVKDDFGEGGWTLKAGALVLASGGLSCLHPESQIIADNKVKKIAELFKEKDSFNAQNKQTKETIKVSEVSLGVPCWNETEKKMENRLATKVRRKKYSGKILEVKLSSGNKLKLTPDHLLLDGSDLKWKKAEEFSKEDFVLSPLKLPSVKEQKLIIDYIPENWIVSLSKKEKEEVKQKVKEKFSTLAEFNQKFGLDRNFLSGQRQVSMKKFREITEFLGFFDYWKTRELNFSRKFKTGKLAVSEITPKMSYLFGFIYGDGHVRISKRRSSFQIVQSTNHPKQIERIRKCWKSVFNENTHEYKRRTSSIIKGKKVSGESITFTKSHNTFVFLYNYFTENKLSRLFSLSDENLSAFIAGSLDSDGCVSIKNYTKKGKKYQQAHIEFLLNDDFQESLNFALALRRFDCYGKVSRKREKVLNITVSGRNDVATLLNAVKKYSCKVKKIPLRKNLVSGESDKIPKKLVSEICMKIAKNNTSQLVKQGLWSTVHYFIKNKIQPSREQLKKIIEAQNIVINESILTEAEKLITRDYFLDKIILIKEKEFDGFVYDLFVPENHNFVSNGTIVHNCIDEFDKMEREDRSAMHEAMEQQMVSVAKAGIVTRFKTETSILAAANPKFARFDPYEPFIKQIDLPATLISRFDLFFMIRDVLDRVKDEEITSSILKTHKAGEMISQEKKTGKKAGKEMEELKALITPIIDTELLKKYLSYARQKVSPVLSDEAMKALSEFYLSLREMGKKEGSYAATHRQLEGLVRLSEASARVRLSNIVEKTDAEKAIKLLKNSLQDVVTDPETGKIDMDIINIGQTHSKLTAIRNVLSIIRQKSQEQDLVPIIEVIEEAKAIGLEKDKVNEIISDLKRKGEIYEKKHGFVSPVDK